jgi:integrase
MPEMASTPPAARRPRPVADAATTPMASPVAVGDRAAQAPLGIDPASARGAAATPERPHIEGAGADGAGEPAGDVTALVADVARRLHLAPDEAARLVRLSRRSERALAPGTVRALRTDIARWVAWCAEAGRLPLPARPQDVADFLEARAAQWSPATLRRVLAALARLHRVLGIADPTKDDEVHLARAAALRMCAERGAGRPRQAAGLTVHATEACVAPLGERLIDRRDLALVLVARDLLARRSELVALQVTDLAPAVTGGATVQIVRSKTDQAGQGAVRYIGRAAYAAVSAWLEAAAITDGPLFRSVHVTGRVGAALHPQKVTEILKKLARRAGPALWRLGVDPERVSGHSPRVGMAQDLVAAGFELGAIMQAGRWKSPAMVARYTEALAAEEGAVAQLHEWGGPRSRAGGATRAGRHVP